MMFKRQFDPPAEVPNHESGQPEKYCKATQHRKNWRIESGNDPAIFVQHQSLPVAISEMKKLLGITEIVVVF